MEEDEPFDLETAWAGLQHAMGFLLAICGGAAALAQRLLLRRASRIEILQWLAPLEALARRLLLLEALKLPAPNAPAPFAKKGKLASAFTDCPAPELPEDAEQWNVRFHVWTAGARLAGQGAGMVQTARTRPLNLNAIPLAKRIEALRRLYEQRGGYARRLAARLHHALPRACRVFAPYRHSATPVRSLLRDVQREVEIGLLRLNSS
jgi:hypothetical protein